MVHVQKQIKGFMPICKKGKRGYLKYMNCGEFSNAC